jgi:hypothetical protein
MQPGSRTRLGMSSYPPKAAEANKCSFADRRVEPTAGRTAAEDHGHIVVGYLGDWLSAGFGFPGPSGCRRLGGRRAFLRAPHGPAKSEPEHSGDRNCGTDGSPESAPPKKRVFFAKDR